MNHIYTTKMQKATRFKVDLGKLGRRWIKTPGNRLLWTWCCNKRRPAKNLVVQAYYDHTAVWCAPGKGCHKGSGG
jgi:hypothetical protein